MTTPLQTFLAKVVDEHARCREPVQDSLIAIDESLNHPLSRQLVTELVTSGVAGAADTLWYQLRKRTDGSHVLLEGSRPPKIMPVGHQVGRPVKHWTWPDERVVEAVIARFGVADRIVLLSENTRLNQRGLRRILREEVGPALQQHKLERLCLLALFKKGKSSMPAYVKAVRSTLERIAFVSGYQEILL
jgi:hypothetical protein